MVWHCLQKPALSIPAMETRATMDNSQYVSLGNSNVALLPGEDLCFSTNPINPGDLIRFRSINGLSIPNRETARKSLGASLYSLAAYVKGEYVAWGRIVGDGALNFYIQDLIVLPGWQRRGLGSALMDKLIAWIKANGMKGSIIGVLSPKEKTAFFKKFGFKGSENPNGLQGLYKILD